MKTIKKEKKATTVWGCRFDGTINLKECLCGIGQYDRIPNIQHKGSQCEKP